LFLKCYAIVAEPHKAARRLILGTSTALESKEVFVLPPVDASHSDSEEDDSEEAVNYLDIEAVEAPISEPEEGENLSAMENQLASIRISESRMSRNLDLIVSFSNRNTYLKCLTNSF